MSTIYWISFSYSNCNVSVCFWSFLSISVDQNTNKASMNRELESRLSDEVKRVQEKRKHHQPSNTNKHKLIISLLYK